jgi:curved DNA-binding protein CbpA
MFDNAFKVLGIEPTTDGRIIRLAYVRLARIYHPDRFVGLPSDVRAEAERRMKEATAAYETLRAAKKTAAASAPASTRRGKKDPWDEVRRAREAIVARRLELERSRARWLLWEELERQARDRAAFEAQQASTWLDDNGPSPRIPEPSEYPVEPERSGLSRRLEEARNGPSDALTPARRAR